MFLFFVILTVFNACIVGINSQITYNYDFGVDGKATPPWPATCDSLTIPQSPVNIVDADVMEFPYPPVLNIEMHSVKPESILATKDGVIGIEYRFKYPNNQRPTLSGGPLGNEIYTFEKLHFHWNDNCLGSEHAINYKKYAAEAHLVYFNSKYPNIDQAANAINNDGIVVIAVLVELVITEGRKDSELGKLLNKVTKYPKVLKPFSLIYEDVVILPDAEKNILRISDIIENKYFSYYGYKGTLTSPPCSKGVTWIISRDTLKLHAADVDLIQKQRLGTPDLVEIKKNARPLQKLGDRAVYLFSNI